MCSTFTFLSLETLIFNELHNVLESFDLIQHIRGPVHEQGHTLDLVMSHGFNVEHVDIIEILISDHKSIMFGGLFPSQSVATKATGHLSRKFS